MNRKEAKNEQEEVDTINDGLDLFEFDEDKFRQEEEEEMDLSEYDNIVETVQEEQEEQEEEEGDPNELNFDEDIQSEDKEEDDEDEEYDEDLDLEKLNKKLGKDYKSLKELKDALSAEDKGGDNDSKEDEIEEIEKTLAVYRPLMALSDEDLMRKQFETIALQQNKDLNDEYVQMDIEDEVQALVDSHTLYLRAKDLRQTLESKIITPALEKKSQIESQKQERENQKRALEKEQLQDAFAEIFNSKSFFGIKPTKNKIVEVYKKVDSGDFLKRISSDKNIQAKLATLLEYEDEIFKKASGLTYGEGMKAVLDEFKSKKNNSSLSRAQRRGSSAGSDKSGGLLQDILRENPSKKEDENKLNRV